MKIVLLQIHCMHRLVQGGGREERFKVPSIVLISIRPEAHMHFVLIKVYVTSDLN